jgi:hypothetical protein
MKEKLDPNGLKTSGALNSSSLPDSSVTENELVDIREQLKIFKYELVKEINEQACKFESNLENYVLQKNKKIDEIGLSSKKSVEREKVFKHRESILTDLFKISHLKTIRHIFISILMILCFQLVVHDLIHLGR